MVAQVEKVSVLMVCLGICRSPMAEAVLNDRIAQRSSLKERFRIEVDSAGTGAYHAGDNADERTIATCKKHKIPISCRARKVTKDDFARFDYILAMDNDNLSTLKSRAPPGSKAHITLFGAYDDSSPSSTSSTSSPPHGTTTKSNEKTRAGRTDRFVQEIQDPYYGGKEGFEECFKRCVKFADGFLDRLEGTRGE